MQHMGWDKHMAEIRMSEMKRALIFELIAPPLPHELAYKALTKVVEDYIRRGMQIGWGHNNHSRVRKHLAQGACISPNAYGLLKPLAGKSHMVLIILPLKRL